MGNKALSRDIIVHTWQGALPLCDSQQCDITSKFQESIDAAKALCVALRLEHANLLQVYFAQSPRRPRLVLHLHMRLPAAAAIRAQVQSAGQKHGSDSHQAGHCCSRGGIEHHSCCEC
jgi:hypothetical protein